METGDATTAVIIDDEEIPGRFDAAQEAAFRAFRLRRDVMHTSILSSFAAMGQLALVFNDLRLGSEHITLLLELRLAIIAWALSVVPLLQRTESPAGRDWFLTLGVLMVDACSVVVATTRPPQHIGFIIPLGMVVLLHFAVLAVPLTHQLALAGGYLVAHLLIMIQPARAIDPSNVVTALTIGVGGLLAGAFLSSSIDRSDRRAFALLARERELKDALARAAEEVNALRGLLPICQFCKAIRDPQGDWHPVEAYVSRRTDARFSHGICPDCMARRYPDDPTPTPR